MAPRACQGTTASGLPCATAVVGDTSYCPWHSDPESASAYASELGKRGAVVVAERKAKLAESAARRVPLSTVEEIRDFLESEAAQASATSDTGRSRAAAAIAKAAQDLLPVAALQEENKQLRALLGTVSPSALRAMKG